MTEPISKHLIVSGRVQGVGYRAWTQRIAQDLDLAGWVRNRSEGTVEAVLHGPKEAIRKAIEKMESGPLVAKVDDVTVSHHSYEGDTGFDIRKTV